MNNGTLLLRGTIGPFFMGHGAQKLFGVAGGHGLKATAQGFEGMGIKPGLLQAALAGSSELAGGAGLALGYRTPLAAAAIVATMTTAIQKVHGKNGWSTQSGGYEYNAVLIAAAVAVAERGPGALSLDALRGRQRSGGLWGLFALGAGVGGALLADRFSGYFDRGDGSASASEPAGAPATHQAPVAAEPAASSEPLTVVEVPAASTQLPSVETPLDGAGAGSDS